MRRVESWFFVVPHASDDAVCEVAFVEAACFSPGFAFTGFAVDVDAGILNIALLGDAGDVEQAVYASVPTEIEPMPDRQSFTLAR